MAKISPAEYVIGIFGGLSATARAAGVSAASTVQGWKERGRIPQDYWTTLIDAAKASGKKVSLADFINEHEVGQ